MGKISLSNIAEELAVRNGLTREAADNFMRAFVETIEKGLQEDGMVKVKGLGTFKLQEVSDRGSVDVNTGERITIKGYRKVTFTPDSAMKELVNRPFAHFEPTELNDGYPAEEELVTSDDAADDNEGGEVVEEVVETLAEDTVAEEPTPAVEAPHEEVVEMVETLPAVEPEVNEPVAEDTVEEVMEEAAEQPAPFPENAPEQGEKPEEAPKQEAALIQEAAPAQEPKKRRGCGCWVTMLVLLALAVILAFTFGWLTLPEAGDTPYEEETEEYGDIVVKPNLEEELGAEWGDEPKVEQQLPIKKEETPATSESRSTAQADQQTGDTVQKAPASVAVENVKPQVKESETPVAEAAFCAVTLTESLKAKAVKDITPADTTDYTMAGTLVTHELKRGETIIQLANKYYGDKRLWPYIVKYNRMRNFNNVAVGQKIEIPVLKEKLVE